MSSKVRVRRKDNEAQPIAWPAARASGGAVQRPQRVAEPSASPGPELPPDARQAAFKEGEAAGRRAAQEELRPLLQRLAHTIEELAALRPGLREQAEKDVVRLAVAIARRVVRRELTIDPQAVTGLAKAALEQLASEERMRVRVHREDAAALRSLLAQAGRADSIEVTADAALERGSAIFETTRGNLDASAETQLSEIERGLTDRLRGNV